MRIIACDRCMKYGAGTYDPDPDEDEVTALRMETTLMLDWFNMGDVDLCPECYPKYAIRR